MLGAGIGRDRSLVLGLQDVGLLAAAEGDEVLDDFRILGGRSAGVAQAIVDGGAGLALRQDGQIELVLDELVARVRAHHPAADELHRHAAGLELLVVGHVGEALQRRGDTVHGHQLHPGLDRFLGLGLIKAALAVFKDEAAILIDEVVVAALGVVRRAEALHGVGGQLLRSVAQGFPGPGLVRIGEAGGVKELLVVRQRDGIVILRHGVLLALEVVQRGDAGRIRRVIQTQVGQVQKGAGGNVLEELVGVHPEDVRERAAHRGRLELHPVLIPRGHLGLDLDIGMLGHIGLSNRLHARLLVGIPETEGERDLFLGQSKTAHRGQQAQSQKSRKNLFHYCAPPCWIC